MLPLDVKYSILNWSRPDLNLWAWCQSIIWNLMTQTSYIEPVWSLLTRLSKFNSRLYIFHTFCIHIVAPQYRLWIVIFFFFSLNRWPWNNSWVIGVPCPTSIEIGARSQLWQQNQDVLFPWGTFVTGSPQGWIVYISKSVCVCAGGCLGFGTMLLRSLATKNKSKWMRICPISDWRHSV